MRYLRWYLRSLFTIFLGLYMVSMPTILSLKLIDGWPWWTLTILTAAVGLISGILALFGLFSGECIPTSEDDDWFLGTIVHTGVHTYIGAIILIGRYAWIGLQAS